MAKQLSLFDHAELSRSSDAETSQVAARHIEPKLTGLRQQFVHRLQAIGSPATAQEVAAGNESLRKRALECVRLGFIREAGTKICDHTKQRATAYWVV